MVLKVVLPEVELDWEGEWVGTDEYNVGDVVYRAGSSYRAKQSSFGKDPLDQPDYWEFVAKKGDQGEQGIQGIQGPAAAGQSVRYEFQIPSAVWEVTHGLDGYPGITTSTLAGKVIYGVPEYVDVNTVRVTFSTPLTGYLDLT